MDSILALLLVLRAIRRGLLFSVAGFVVGCTWGSEAVVLLSSVVSGTVVFFFREVKAKSLGAITRLSWANSSTVRYGKIISSGSVDSLATMGATFASACPLRNPELLRLASLRFRGFSASEGCLRWAKPGLASRPASTRFRLEVGGGEAATEA